jgi:hypothetical protein
MVCVHDGVDDMCGSQAFGGSAPPECAVFSPAPTNSQPTTGETSRYVEIRYCYKFTSITQTSFFSFGPIFLQGTRTFTVTDY